MTKIGKKLAAVLLTFAMVVTFMPIVGTQAVYAEDAVEISGEVDASTLTPGGNYVLTGDTTINVDVSNMLGTINIGASNLTITGEEGEILSTTGISGSVGKLYLKSATLEVDTSASTGRYPTAIDLPNGEVHIEGGGLFINFTSNGTEASTSYGINCANFFMTEGTATITCTAVNSGRAVGLACDDFEMYGGSMGVDGTTQVSGMVGYGISNRGNGSAGDFYMAGGGLRAEGRSLSESYGIDWLATSSNTVVIEGGTLEATGQFTALRSWCNVLFSGGAQVTLTATDATGVSIDGGSLTVQGFGTKLTVNTGEGTAVAVYDGGINLLEGTEILTPEGGEVKDAGTMMTIANGSGNTASDVVIENLTIPPRDIKDASVTGLSDKTYTGEAITQTPVVTLDSTTLEPETDYTVAYENNTNAGTATVVITGKGNYTGTVEKTFEITPKEITPSVSLSKSAFTYNGKTQKPTVTVKDGSKKLVSGKDYTVTNSGRKSVGKGTVKVTLKGNYSGSKTVTYKINPKGKSIKSVTAGSKSVTVKWTKQATKMSTSYISGYQIYAATDSKFSKNVKKVYVPKYSSTSKKLTALKGGKKYYVKIRTYKTVSGVKYYSPWSTVKTVTTKK